MTTYERGKEPHGAPYTYDKDHLGFVGRVYGPNGTVDEDLSKEIERPKTADRVLRAFHLAKLAEDYAKAKAAHDDEDEWIQYMDASRALCEAVRS